MPSEVDLANLALSRLGEEPIIAVDDETVAGVRIGRLLPSVRDYVLRLDTWRCCLKRVQIPALAQAPLGYSKSFPLPNDFLKLVALRLERYKDWSLVGNNINTDFEEGPLEILYVFREDDTNKYSPELYDVMAWRLAFELSGFVSTSTVRKQETFELYQNALMNAVNLNALENPVTQIVNSTWVDARYTNIDRGLYGDSFYTVG